MRLIIKKIVSITILLFIISNNVIAQNKNVITETSFAGITKTSKLTDLNKLFGKQNITTAIDFGAEGGDSIITSVVFKGTPKEIIIFWKENEKFNTIEMVKCTASNAPYIVYSQLKVGTSLQKLVTINKNKISFSGFGWDYGGIISSYNKGVLVKSKINFTLNIKDNVSNKFFGEANFNTDMPLVKKYLTKIYINSISVAFN